MSNKQFVAILVAMALSFCVIGIGIITVVTMLTETPAPEHLPAPTPVEQATEMPVISTPAPTATPEAAGEIVELLSESLTVSEYGWSTLEGVVKNISGYELGHVQVVVTLYDADMNIVATDWTFTTMQSIPPGGTSPFQLSFDDVIPGRDFATYTIQFQEY